MHLTAHLVVVKSHGKLLQLFYRDKVTSSYDSAITIIHTHKDDGDHIK